MEKKTGEQRELSWERLSMVYSRETEGEKNKKAMEKQETRAYSWDWEAWNEDVKWSSLIYTLKNL